MKNNVRTMAQPEPAEVRAARNLIANHYAAHGAPERAAALRAMTLRDAVGVVLADLSTLQQREPLRAARDDGVSLTTSWSRLRERMRAWMREHP